MSRKFLIGQLACFGDCLYATTVAKQIKSDFPDSHITWAVATKYKSILLLNPFIDEIWDIEIINNDFYKNGWKLFEAEAIKRQASGIYDALVFTQLNPIWENLDGTIRSSTLRGYKRPITVSVDPVVRLSDKEVKNVKIFAEKNKLSSYKEVILFECSPGSGQSFINLNLAIEIAEAITNDLNNVCFILSSPNPLNLNKPNIIDASELSYRENAELTKYCTLLIGCSSGITWLATSDWAKKINMLQLLSREFRFFAGIKYDFERWNLPTSNVIEVTVNDINYIVNCITTILKHDFSAAKKQFDEIYQPQYFNFRDLIAEILVCNQIQGFKKLNIVLKVTSNYANANKHLNGFILLYMSLLEIFTFCKSKIIK